MIHTITGKQSELGRLLAHQTTAPAGVHFNLSGQHANTLLHDGHAWKNFAQRALAGARRARRADAQLLVHAGFAFICADPPKDPLRSLAQAMVECEQLALAGPVPAVVVRLGYLYGPSSKDLRAYRRAFLIGRPYWAGKRHAAQFHLHHDDAVTALLAAANRKNVGKVLYATGGPAMPFMRFMDHFAKGVGRRHPLHIPLITAPLMQLVVHTEHVQQTALGMPDRTPTPRVPGWKPLWPNPALALDAILASWRS